MQNAGPDPATNVVMTIPDGRRSGVRVRQRPVRERAVSSGSQVVAAARPDRSGIDGLGHGVRHGTSAGNHHPDGSVASAENQLNIRRPEASTNVNVLESAGSSPVRRAEVRGTEDAGVAAARRDSHRRAPGLSRSAIRRSPPARRPGSTMSPPRARFRSPTGQTSATIQVPVLADPWDNHDEYVNVVLGSPTGGASPRRDREPRSCESSTSTPITRRLRSRG